jgi:hypothetical protein
MVIHGFDTSFKYILSNPPSPLTKLDIRYQIGHVYEQKKEVYSLANFIVFYGQRRI